MMGISTVSRRRFPSSLSSRPIGAPRVYRRALTAAPQAPDVNALVVARNRFDGRDHFLIGDLFGGTDEGGVTLVHEDRQIALRVAPQRVDQFLTFRVVQGSKI